MSSETSPTSVLEKVHQDQVDQAISPPVLIHSDRPSIDNRMLGF